MDIKLQTNEQLSVTVANGLSGVFVNGTPLISSIGTKADVSSLTAYYQKSETSSGSQISTELKKYQLSGNYLSSNALNNYYQKSETSSSSQISTALSSYAKSSDVKNSTITVKQGDVTKGSFTLNQASNYTLSLDSGGGGGGVIFDDRISGFTGENQLSVVKLSADEYAQMLDDGTCLSNALYIVEAPNIDAFKQQIKNVAPPTDLSDAATKEYVDNALTNVQIPTDLSAFTNSPGYTTNVGTITGITMNGASKGTSGNVNLGTVLTAHQSLANYYTKSETSSASQISTALSTKSTVSFNRITTSGTNIGSITIDGTTTQIYAPSGGGGGSSVQVSADYSTGTRVATISVDSVPTSIYVPNGGGGSGRYALETATLQSAGTSLSCAVQDQAITTIQVSSSSTPIIVQLPEAPQDGARDFIMRIEISSSSAPTFTFNGVGETIDFDSEDDDWAVLEPGLNLISFTETKRGAGTNSGGSAPTYCTVTFDIENGQQASNANATFVNSSDATRQVEAGQPVGTLPTLNYVSSQYTFQGWYTTSNPANGQQVTNQTVIINDITFYAIFNYTGGGGSND